MMGYLLRNRIVFVGGRITDQVCAVEGCAWCGQWLMYAARSTSTKYIRTYLPLCHTDCNTSGGTAAGIGGH